MEIIRRLEIIAQMENVPIIEFDLDSLRKLITNPELNPTKVLFLEFDGDKLRSVSLEASYTDKNQVIHGCHPKIEEYFSIYISKD